MDTMKQVMEENARLKQEVAGLKEKNDHLSRVKDMQNFFLSALLPTVIESTAVETITVSSSRSDHTLSSDSGRDTTASATSNSSKVDND